MAENASIIVGQEPDIEFDRKTLEDQRREVLTELVNGNFKNKSHIEFFVKHYIEGDLSSDLSAQEYKDKIEAILNLEEYNLDSLAEKHMQEEASHSLEASTVNGLGATTGSASSVSIVDADFLKTASQDLANAQKEEEQRANLNDLILSVENDAISKQYDGFNNQYVIDYASAVSKWKAAEKIRKEQNLSAKILSLGTQISDLTGEVWRLDEQLQDEHSLNERATEILNALQKRSNQYAQDQKKESPETKAAEAEFDRLTAGLGLENIQAYSGHTGNNEKRLEEIRTALKASLETTKREKQEQIDNLTRQKNEVEETEARYKRDEETTLAEKQKCEKLLQGSNYDKLLEVKQNTSKWLHPLRYRRISKALRHVDSQVASAIDQRLKFESQLKTVADAVELRRSYADTPWRLGNIGTKTKQWFQIKLGSKNRKFNKLLKRSSLAQLEKITEVITKPDELTTPATDAQKKAYNVKLSLYQQLTDKIKAHQSKLETKSNKKKAKVATRIDSEQIRKSESIKARIKNTLDMQISQVRADMIEKIKETDAYKLALKFGKTEEALNTLIQKHVTDDRVMYELVQRMSATDDEKMTFLENLGLKMDAEKKEVVKKSSEKGAPSEEEQSVPENTSIQPTPHNVEQEDNGNEISINKSKTSSSDEMFSWIIDNDSPNVFSIASNGDLNKDNITQLLDKVKTQATEAGVDYFVLNTKDFNEEEIELFQKVANEKGLIIKNEKGEDISLKEKKTVDVLNQEEKKDQNDGKTESQNAANSYQDVAKESEINSVGENKNQPLEKETTPKGNTKEKGTIDRLKELSGRDPKSFAARALKGEVNAKEEIPDEIRNSNEFENLKSVNTFKAMERYLDSGKEEDKLDTKQEIDLHEEMHKEVKKICKVSDIEVDKLPKKEELDAMPSYQKDATIALYNLNKAKEEYKKSDDYKALDDKKQNEVELAFMQKKTRIISSFIEGKNQPKENKTITVGERKFDLSQIAQKASESR